MLSPTPASQRSDPAITAGPPADEAGGILTIDLSALEANYKTLRSASVPAECAAVVKADGYGLGLEQVAGQLVANRAAAPSSSPIWPRASGCARCAATPRSTCSTACRTGTGQVFADHDLRPVLGSSAELAEWDAFSSGAKCGRRLRIHVDTGMNRLGISAEEAAAIAPRIDAETTASSCS